MMLTNTPMFVPMLVVVLAFLSVFLIVISVPGLVNTGFIGVFRGNTMRRMEQWHKDLFVTSASPKEHVAWMEWGVGISFVVILVLSRNIILAALIAFLLWKIPDLVYWHLSKVRREKFDEHLPVVLDQLTSATRAGRSLSQAISDVSLYAPYPVSQELGQITNDQTLGIDLSTSLKAARDRVGSKSFSLAVTAMLVNTDLGGNLPQTMTVMSASLKEIWRLDQKLHTASAEGRKGGMILCVMPLVILAIVLIMQPQLIATLFSSAIGYIVLIAAVALYFAGLFWMYRILQVDI